MKKIFIFVASLLVVAPSAFATDNVTIGTWGDAGKELRGARASVSSSSALIGKTSTGVGLGMRLDATNGAGYALVTQHKNGTKAFGSSYDSTAIYTTIADGTPGAVILNVPNGTDTAYFTGTDWKAM